MQTEEIPTPFKLLNMICATWTTQLLAAGAELKVADALKSGALSAAEVAERTKTDPAIMYRILRAMGSLGVLKELESRRFELTEMGQLLRSDVPGSMRALAMMLGQPWHNRVWEALADCARNGVAFGAKRAFGTDLWQYFDANKQYFDNFNEAMLGAAENMHVTAVDAYDFSGIRRLVDVGGGYGRLLGMILQKYPTMQGILYDRPPLAEGARKELESLGIANRCEFVGGDFLKSVPGGGDTYIMSHILHDWPDPDALAILRNCREALAKGGKIIVLDAVIRSDSGPDWGKLMDLEMMAMFGGRDRTREELEQLFGMAGFRLQRIIGTKSTTSIVEGIAV